MQQEGTAMHNFKTIAIKAMRKGCEIVVRSDAKARTFFIHMYRGKENLYEDYTDFPDRAMKEIEAIIERL